MSDDDVDKVLLIPRFSAFVGTGPFHTAPMNTRDYGRAFITAWRGAGIGSPASTAAVVVQESADLAEWANLGEAVAPSTPNSEATGTFDLRLEWIRLHVVTAGSPAAITMWAVGNFLKRQA
jgi:hypothetical protein